LSERPETTYSLRTRSHNKLLIQKTSDLDDLFTKTYTNVI